MEQIHGHEILRLMLESGKVFTRASLVSTITATFGTDARFYTCSADNLTAEGIVDFLQAKGKFLSTNGGIQMTPDRMCQH